MPLSLINSRPNNIQIVPGPPLIDIGRHHPKWARRLDLRGLRPPQRHVHDRGIPVIRYPDVAAPEQVATIISGALGEVAGLTAVSPRRGVVARALSEPDDVLLLGVVVIRRVLRADPDELADEAVVDVGGLAGELADGVRRLFTDAVAVDGLWGFFDASVSIVLFPFLFVCF